MTGRLLHPKLPPADDPLRFDVEGVTYVFDALPEADGKKRLVRVARESGVVVFRDRVDLYCASRRGKFARAAAQATGRKAREIHGHVSVILDQVERAHGSEPEPVEITDERRARARKLLRRGSVLTRAVNTMTALGYVGEDRNKALAYLVATGRLLPRPPSAIVLASSGCGKSELLETVAALLPPEDVRTMSRITRGALHYAETNYLRHKLVVVDEQEGATEADHAIRVLQSQGSLSHARTVGGRLENHTVHGPIALLSGTTSSELNPENLSRCLELTLDDSPEQTRRVQAAQRRAWAGHRPLAPDLQALQDAQRLLEPLDVVIPFAERLTFPARTTHDRRGNVKLLSLIAAHALLHQHQRKRHEGRLVADLADYAAVHALLSPALELDLHDLSPRAAATFRVLADSPHALTRREIARAQGWNYNTAKAALRDLIEQELVEQTETKRPLRFSVLDRSPLGTRAPLLSPAQLAAELQAELQQPIPDRGSA